MHPLAAELRPRHQAVQPLAGGLRFIRIFGERDDAVPVLAAEGVGVDHPRDHLWGAPAGRFGMRDSLIVEVRLNRVLALRRVEGRVYVVVEREPAGAVEVHIPPRQARPPVAQGVRTPKIVIGAGEELHDFNRFFPRLRPCQFPAVLVGKGLALVRVLEQILADELDMDITVGRHAVGLALVGHELAEFADGVNLEPGCFHVLVEWLRQAGRGQRRDHVGLEMEEIELRRLRQRLGHRARRDVGRRDVHGLRHRNARRLVKRINDGRNGDLTVRPNNAGYLCCAELLSRRNDAVFLSTGEGRRCQRCRQHTGSRRHGACFHDLPARELRKTNFPHDTSSHVVDWGTCMHLLKR